MFHFNPVKGVGGHVLGGLLQVADAGGVREVRDHFIQAVFGYQALIPAQSHAAQDLGEGVVGEDGLVYITIDPILSEAVTLTQYQVFLQPYGEGSLHIEERTPSYFIVKGTPGLAFGWELKARQKGYEQTRLEQAREFGPAVPAFEDEAVWHMNDIKSSRGL